MLEIKLNGMVALVTGASKGIGKGIADVLASAGANIILNYYDKEDIDAIQTKKQLEEYGVKVELYKVDVSNADACKSMIEDAVKRMGKIDILVNNAGISTVGNLEELSIEEINKVLDINIKGPFLTSKYVIPYMKKNRYGRIINIASTSMYTGGGGGAHYAASKSALMGLARNLAKTYGEYGITTNNLAISLIDTDLFRSRYTDENDRKKVVEQVPVRRLGKPEDIGYMTAFLASHMAGYINGEIIQIDGGRLYG